MSNFEDFIYMDDEALPEQTCEEITKFVKEHKQKFIQLSVKHTAFEPQREKTKQDDMWFYVQCPVFGTIYQKDENTHS